MLIDLVFVSTSVGELNSALIRLMGVLEKFRPGLYPDAIVLASNADKIALIAGLSKEGITRQELVDRTGIESQALGITMSRLAQLGIFKVEKCGRRNVYKFNRWEIDVNDLRREWTWLWAIPYERLSLKYYERRQPPTV